VTTDSGQAPATAATQVAVGMIQAVFDGEPTKTGKKGPGAILMDGSKFKTFDGKHLESARNLKANGIEAKITFKRDEKWRSNDVKAIEAAG
jgi:hypothetical protein